MYYLLNSNGLVYFTKGWFGLVEIITTTYKFSLFFFIILLAKLKNENQFLN